MNKAILCMILCLILSACAGPKVISNEEMMRDWERYEQLAKEHPAQ